MPKVFLSALSRRCSLICFSLSIWLEPVRGFFIIKYINIPTYTFIKKDWPIMITFLKKYMVDRHLCCVIPNWVSINLKFSFVT